MSCVPLFRPDRQTWQLVVYDPAVNQPPEFADTPRDWAIVGETYTYTPEATDPNGANVTYGIIGKPDGASWDEATHAFTWTPTDNDKATHTIIFTASDGVLTQRQVLNLLVRSNAKPNIVQPNGVTKTAGQSVELTVTATDGDSDPLTFSLDAASQGKGISIDESGNITWQIATGAADVGTHAVSVTADDGFGQQDTKSFTITVAADTTDPTVTATVNPDPAQLDREYSITVEASDDVAIATTSLRLVGFTPVNDVEQPLDIAVPLNSGNKGRLTPTELGTYRFEATATDVNGRSATQTIHVDVQQNVAGPSLSIASPAEGAELKEPTYIVGTIIDELDDVQSWTLTATPVDGGATVTLAEASLPNDTTELNNASLGLLDTSVLANGLYILTLSATDEHGAMSSIDRQIEVRGNLKLGNFAFGVTDLTINTPGIPITVSRTYDTLNASKRLDFGYGWKWDVGNPQLEIDYPNSSPTIFAGNYIPFRDGTRVMITLPDGTEEGFTFRPYQKSGNGFGLLFGSEPYTPYFEPDPGVHNYLALKTDVLLTKQLDEYLVSGGADFAFNPAIGFTKNDFVLYTKTGVQYGIDPSGSGRTWIEDQKGNKVEYIPQGNTTLIRHSNSNVPGGLTRTVTVLHDANGRIFQIADPIGNTVDYTYVNGELVAVSNRLGETTSYEYASASDPWFDAERHAHYLKSIVDPLGRRSVAAAYRADGRLGSTQDATGTSTDFSYELTQRTQIATTAGITSVVVGDADGNVVQQQGPTGTTIRNYDSRGRVLDETTIVGDPDTTANGERDDINAEFTYTAYGLPATQTDDRGNSSSLTYDDQGNVTSVTDAIGNTTANTYDDRGNLLTTKTGEVQTTLAYDAWGNVTQISNNANEVLAQSFYNDYGLLVRSVDATGRETHFAYDPLGNQEESWYVDTETFDDGNGPQTRNVTFTSRSVYDAEGRVTATHQLVQRAGQPETFLSSSFTDYNLAGQVFQTRTGATGLPRFEISVYAAMLQGSDSSSSRYG